jgi:hypothetical protein
MRPGINRPRLTRRSCSIFRREIVTTSCSGTPGGGADASKAVRILDSERVQELYVEKGHVPPTPMDCSYAPELG